MLALILVAVSMGFSNLAAAVGMGAGGIGSGDRFRIGVVFGLLEGGMPIIGLLAGQHLASAIGRQAHWLAAALLIALGGYTLLAARRSRRAPSAAPVGSGSLRLGRLLISGLALSLDNLVAGFALGTYQVDIVVGAVIFGTVSVLMSLAGLEFGARIGARLGARADLLGGIVLIAVGAAIGFGAFG